ncbi:hypothetical protein [Thalassococcus sp. S3]|uniref:hypothetical protein n=1 Tax=Thalassococcus sp. S3 TaxID=2017482 RepID=UPI0010241C5D|nr:hypothetical protein [Thalassococcus sp. S3]QBF32223.1 hypothetical protein CFI11_13485 [Thalassococcus sp. S3]
MAQIEELQRRLTAAMARIGQGVDALAAKPEPEDTGEVERLSEALEEEKLANAQLKERIKTLKTKHEAELTALQSRTEGTSEAIDRLDAEVQRLRFANEQLMSTSAGLREVSAEGVAEPNLINKAMLAEIESLRAARAADIAESGAILAQLTPLIEAAQAEADAEEERA